MEVISNKPAGTGKDP
jgi:PAS domain S-box-containing protein